MLLLYFFARNVIGGFMGKAKQPAFDEAGLPVKPTHYTPALAAGTPLSFWALLSEEETLDVPSAQLVWHEENVVLGSIPERTKTVLYHPSKARHLACAETILCSPDLRCCVAVSSWSTS